MYLKPLIDLPNPHDENFSSTSFQLQDAIRIQSFQLPLPHRIHQRNEPPTRQLVTDAHWSEKREIILHEIAFLNSNQLAESKAFSCISSSWLRFIADLESNRRTGDRIRGQIRRIRLKPSHGSGWNLAIEFHRVDVGTGTTKQTTHQPAKRERGS